MKVLIACEESQTVCKAFRAKGHEAYSFTNNRSCLLRADEINADKDIT